jgi:hypothetical protein
MNKLPTLLSFVASWKTTFLGFAAMIAVAAACVSESRLPHGEEWAIILAAIGVTNAKDFNIGSK